MTLSLPLALALALPATIVSSPASAQLTRADKPYVTNLEEFVYSPRTLDAERCKPDYPAGALIREQTGITVLSFRIAATGIVTEATVLKSSGSVLLDEASVAAIKRCRYQPHVVDGRAVTVSREVAYKWVLPK